MVSVEVEKSTVETDKLLAESVNEENTTIKETSNFMKIDFGWGSKLSIFQRFYKQKLLSMCEFLNSTLFSAQSKHFSDLRV